MATTEEYKNGGSASYTFSIEYIKAEDIKVAVDGTNLTYTATNPPAQTTEYTVNGSNVIFKQASVSGSTNGGVRIYRETALEDADSATFVAGSSIRASDLNANHKLVRFSAQEKNQKIVTDDIKDSQITSAKILDGTIVDADISSTAQIAVNKLQDGSPRQLLQTHFNGTDVEWTDNVDIPGTLDVTGNANLDSNLLVAGAADLNGDLDVDGNTNLDNTTIDGYINVTGVATVDNVRIDGNEVRAHSGNLELDSQGGTVTVDDNLTVTGSADIDTNLNVDGTCTVDGASTFANTVGIGGQTTINAHLDANYGASINNVQIGVAGNSEITTASGNLVIDSATGTTTIDDNLTVTGNLTYNGTFNNLTTTEIAILDGATITTAELNTLDGVTATTSELNILDGVTATATEINKLDGVTSTTAELNILDGVTATAAEINTLDGVTATTAELNLNDGQTATPSEVNILDGATVTTAELNKLDGYTGTAADLNEVVAGKSVVETISSTATDAQIPTAQAVNERITTVVSDVGGFVPIANETSFPTDNPDLDNAAGTIVSIKALNSSFTTGSGVTTHTISNGAGSGKNVTITGLTASTTYPAGRGLILETTQYSGGGRGGNANEYEYAFHRLTLDEAGVANAQAVVDDFDERYYGPLGSEPNTRPGGGARVQGDLYFSTVDNQMKVWNNAASQWDDVASSASSNIVTLTPAFNNSETEFTCSTVPVDAQSLLLSINGVVQKPNTGTSTPSEGFVKLANGKIKLASAPATGAPYFAIALGNTVSIGTPSPDTVGATELKNGEIANVHVSSSAAIDGTKISPSFTSDVTITNIGPSLALVDTNHNSDYRVKAQSGIFMIEDTTNSNVARLAIDSSGNVGIGTTGPEEILHIKGSSETVSSRDGVLFQHNTDSDAADTGLPLVWSGRISSTLANYGLASICGRKENSTGGNGAAYLQLATCNSAGSLTERMRIDSSGNVGIGTTSPSNKLVVNSAAHDDGLYVLAANNNQSTRIKLQGKSSGGTEHNWILDAARGEDRFGISNGTSTHLAILDGGNVGIGTTSPNRNLDVVGTIGIKNSSGAQWYVDRNDSNGRFELYQSNSTTNDGRKLSILTDGQIEIGEVETEANRGRVAIKAKNDGGGTAVNLYLQEVSGGEGYGIGVDADGDLNFYNSGATTPTLEVRDDNHVKITDGNLILAAGHGIDFSATSEATGKTSELFNDYEEGTWTPTIGVVGGSFTTNPTYAVRNARYTLIGRQVFVEVYVQFNSDGAINVSGAYPVLSGLPFTCNSAATYPSVSYGWYDLNSSLMNEHEVLCGYVQNSNSYIVFYKVANNGNNNILNAVDFANGQGGNFQINAAYTIA